MRQIFWAVVLLNIFFYLWNILIPEKEARNGEANVASTSEKGVKKIVLLSEKNKTSKSIETPMPNSADVVCFSFGPFRTLKKATSAVMLLNAEGMQSIARKLEKRNSKGFWVLMPPLEDKVEAKRQLRKMHQANVDSFIVTAGEKKNAISVGIYTSRRHAEKRRDDLRNKGFDIVIEERFSKRTFYWVNINQSTGPEIPADLEERLTTQYQEQRLESRACN